MIKDPTDFRRRFQEWKIRNQDPDYVPYYVSGKPKTPKVEYVYDVLPRLFAQEGYPIYVSSGYRNSYIKGTNMLSRHAKHQAADIIPLAGSKTTFADIRRILDDPNSSVSKWMMANGYGYLDETSATGTTKHWFDHKRDHSHYHIGMDSTLVPKYAKMINDLKTQVASDTAKNISFVSPTLDIPQPVIVQRPSSQQVSTINQPIPPGTLPNVDIVEEKPLRERRFLKLNTRWGPLPDHIEYFNQLFGESIPNRQLLIKPYGLSSEIAIEA